MRPVCKWQCSRPLLVAATLTCLVAGILILLWPPNPITRANFQGVRVGMSLAELHGLLGTPDCQTVELGLVQGPETYTVSFGESDDQRRGRGFRDCRREQWTSPEVTIIVISDMDGRVVCRYSGDGQRFDWLAFLRRWLPR